MQDDARLRLGRAAGKKLEQSARALEALSSRPIMDSPMAFIDRRRQDVDRLGERLDAAQRHILSVDQQNYIRLTSALEALSPLKVLSRGYSLSTDAAGTVLRSAHAVDTGDRIHVRLMQGGLDCLVERRTEA